MVKVDERKRQYLTTRSLIYRYHLSVVAGKKKENIATETTALATQREATYPDEKKRANTNLEFFARFSVR